MSRDDRAIVSVAIPLGAAIILFDVADDYQLPVARIFAWPMIGLALVLFGLCLTNVRKRTRR